MEVALSTRTGNKRSGHLASLDRPKEKEKKKNGVGGNKWMLAIFETKNSPKR